MIATHGTAGHVEKVVRCFRRAKALDEESLRQVSLRQVSLRPAWASEPIGKQERILYSDLPVLPAYLPQAYLTRFTCPKGLLPILEHGPAALNGGDRHLVTVHVAAETLRHKTAGCCEIEDGPGLAAETVRRLACDASVVAIVEDEDGEPLSAGRKTRTVAPALRRLLNARDRGCRFQVALLTRAMPTLTISITGRTVARQSHRISCFCASIINVPSSHFGQNYAKSMLNAWSICPKPTRMGLSALTSSIRSGNQDVTWNTANWNAYINALVSVEQVVTIFRLVPLSWNSTRNRAT